MRVTTSKSKNAESFYINHAYIDENGKSTSRIYKKLGTLKELSEKLGTDRDGVMAWAREQARIATEEYKKENEAISVSLFPNRILDKDQDRTFNCGYLFLQSIYYHLRLDKVCRNIRRRHDYQYDMNAILSDLIFARILDPSSRLSTYQYCQSLLERPGYELHDLYRALSVLSQESDYIQAELYRNSNFLHKRNTQILYYDCTNYYFEIEQEDAFRKYGKSKEHRPNPIIEMGLFMDADGFPLAFDLFQGNLNEQKTLKGLEQKILDNFDCAQFVYCSDAGLGSKSNRVLNAMQGRSYVITQSLKKLKKEIREQALDPTGYRKIGSRHFIDLRKLDTKNKEVYDSIYYKEIPLETKDLDEILVVTYSPKYADYQRKIRQSQIDRAMRMINENGKIKKNRKNPNDPARFLKKMSCTEQGEIVSEEYCVLDEEAIDKEAIYDGFYAVVTSLVNEDIDTILFINKRRWQIEECFRIMKTDFDARPVHLQREDRIRAHFLICFMALLFYRVLDSKLKGHYSAGELISTIKDMKMTLLEGYGYIPAYTRNDITDDLHETFGFRTDHQIIQKKKMRSIIHKTKDAKTLL